MCQVPEQHSILWGLLIFPHLSLSTIYVLQDFLLESKHQWISALIRSFYASLELPLSLCLAKCSQSGQLKV